MSVGLIAIAVTAAFAVAKCQAYMIAGLGNLIAFGPAKVPDDLGQWAILRRYNYLWFLPMVLSAFVVENGQSYPALSPQANLILISILSFSIGICCTFRDVLERRFGVSVRRGRGARIYAMIVTGLMALIFFIEEVQ